MNCSLISLEEEKPLLMEPDDGNDFAKRTSADFFKSERYQQIPWLYLKRNCICTEVQQNLQIRTLYMENGVNIR